MDVDFIKLKQADSILQELNSLLALSVNKEETFIRTPSQSLLTEIKDIRSTTLDQFEKSARSIDETLRLIEELIIQKSSNEIPQNSLLFSKKEISHMVYQLFKTPIKTIGIPIPRDVGCNAYRKRKIERGEFVCAKVAPNDFQLMIAIKQNGSNLLCVAPANETAIMEFSESEWTALPTLVPQKPSARHEFAKNAQVLALVAGSDEYVQTAFVPGVVVSKPSDPQPEGFLETVYSIKIEDESVWVPQKFVIKYPDNWKQNLY